MSHLDQKTLMAFLRGELSVGEAETIYEHLLLCPRCDGYRRSLNQLRNDFDGSWEVFLDEWQRLRQEPVLRLVAFIKDDPPLALGTFDPRTQSEWASEDLPEQMGVAGQDTKRSRKLEKEACESVVEGDRSRAEALLKELKAQDPEKAALSRKKLSPKEVASGRQVEAPALFVVDAKRRTVSVLVNEPTLGTFVRLVTDTGSCQETPLTPVSGASYRLAEFEGVESGWYTLEILGVPLPETS